jgi:hypothetical protein
VTDIVEVNAVREETEPSAPFQYRGDTNVEVNGSNSVDPGDIIMEEMCEVSRGWLV